MYKSETRKRELKVTLEETVKIDIQQDSFHEKAINNQLSKEDLERLENTRKMFQDEIHV